MYDSDLKRLEELAAGNERREKILEARKKRCKARARHLTCTTCGETEFSNRDVLDPCASCLKDLWSARDIMERAHDTATANGLIPVVLPERPHDQPYPGLATTHEKVPPQALFARGRSFVSSEVEGSDRTLQILLHEIVVAMAIAYPSDPEGQKNALSLFTMQKVGHYAYGEVHARMPLQAATALCHIWHLFRWHSHEAYRQGFEAGNNLLLRMNDGGATHEQFTTQVAEQTKRIQERLARNAEGIIQR